MGIMGHQEIYHVNLKHIVVYAMFFLFVFSCKDTSLSVVKQTDLNLILENGVLFYRTHPFSGTIVSNYSKKLPKYQAQYKDGKKHGPEKKWFSNGVLAEERFYTDGFKTGLHRSWWEGGGPKFQYYFNDTGAFHGEVKEWYPSGQLFRSFNYLNGQEVGRQRLWKLDGAIKANYEVVNNERYGLIGLKKCYTVTKDSDAIK